MTSEASTGTTRNRPGVHEDELEIKTSAEHKHVAIETHLGDGAARQRVANGDEADVVVAVLNVQHVGDCVLTSHFDISTAVNHLKQQQHSSQPQSQTANTHYRPHHSACTTIYCTVCLQRLILHVIMSSFPQLF